ncbi:MAG: hypothetical protein QHH00_03765 [Methanomassiliicoccales archaeon]|jgi:glutamate synthase domain-containing protein 3|nr:hypothetical protein [Methanomassiliicoccales archaeon]
MAASIDCTDLDMRICNERIRELIGTTDRIEIFNASHIDGLCGGLRSGKALIHGDVGDYFGILNAGAELVVTGSSGRFLGDGMTAGRIEVGSDVGDGAAVYCYGGVIRIRGSAGDFLGTMNKGATIIVEGDIGNNAGTYMVGGDIVVLGDAGKALGDYMIRGAIYIAGSYSDLGNNAKLEKLRSSDLDKLDTILAVEGLNISPRAFQKIIPATFRPFYSEKTQMQEGGGVR